MAIKYLTIGEGEFRQIRQLVSSTEFMLIPEGDILNFKPDRQEILMAMFRIREATKRIEIELMKNWPD